MSSVIAGTSTSSMTGATSERWLSGVTMRKLLGKRMRGDVSTRFWARTVSNGECVEWVGPRNLKGYGTFRASANRGSMLVHRWAWEQAYGPIPDGKEIDHLCRNRACVNVAHLEAVSHRTNVRRGIRNRPRIYCPRGHLFRDGYVGPNGCLQCRICKAIEARLRRRVALWSTPIRRCALMECSAPFKSYRAEQRCCSKRCGGLLGNREDAGKVSLFGRPFPLKAVILVLGGTKVICEDTAYRALLSARAAARAAGGDPNADLICARCRECKPRTAFNRSSSSRRYMAWCRECSNAYCREYEKTRAPRAA
jgi:hypothetical protein